MVFGMVGDDDDNDDDDGNGDDGNEVGIDEDTDDGIDKFADDDTDGTVTDINVNGSVSGFIIVVGGDDIVAAVVVLFDGHVIFERFAMEIRYRKLIFDISTLMVDDATDVDDDDEISGIIC